MNTQEKFSTERWDELSRQWERDEITIEQLNGQMLVWIGELYRMMEVHQRDQDGLAIPAPTWMRGCRNWPQGCPSASAVLEIRVSVAQFNNLRYMLTRHLRLDIALVHRFGVDVFARMREITYARQHQQAK